MNSAKFARVAVASAALVLCGASHAATSALTGTVGATPQMPVVTISTPTCASQEATLVNSQVQPFNVTVSGNYSVTVTAVTGGLTSNATSFYVYANAFDPTNGMTNCFAGANTPDPWAEVPAAALVAGTTYFLVVFDDTVTQTTDTTPGDFTVTFDGPGIAAAGLAAASTLSQLSLLGLSALLGALGIALARRKRSNS